jgi:hypothetical protein
VVHLGHAHGRAERSDTGRRRPHRRASRGWAYATIRPKSATPNLDRENRQFVVNRRWLAVKFEMINTEPVDVAGQIRTQATHHFGAQMNPFSLQFVQRPGHGKHVVEDQTIGYQMIVFDQLSLIVSIVLSQNSMPAEGNPLCELIEAFALVDRALNDVPQFQVADVVEQEFCANHPTELAEC